MLGHLGCWDEKIGFENLQQVSIKVGESIELPVYNFLSQQEIDAYMKNSAWDMDIN